MILKVLADARKGMNDRDAVRAEECGIADAGKLKQVGRIHRPGAEDDFASGAHRLRPAVAAKLDTA